MKNIFVVCILLAFAACAPQTPAPITTAPTQNNAPAPTVIAPTQNNAPATVAVPQQKKTQPRNTPQAKPPAQNQGGSSASQNLTLDVPAHPFDIILGRATARAVTASVLLYENGQAYIEYKKSGAPPGKTAIHTLSAGEPAEILIDALDADTAYTFKIFYRHGNSGEFSASDEKSFHTARAPGSTFTFAVQADSHLDSNSNLDVYAQTLNNMRATNPDFLIDLGDTFMTDKYQPYTDAAKQYLAQRYFLGTLAPTPLFLVLGNHDGEDNARGGKATDRTAWANEMRTRYFPNPAPDDFYSGNPARSENGNAAQNYYAWEWSDALFVVLDPYAFTTPQRGTSDNWNRTLGDVQYQWLKQTLESSRAKWKFVFIHQLVGGLDKNGRGGAEAAKFYEWGGSNADGSYGFDTMRPDWAMPLHQLFVQNHVDIVFHGHDHLFVKQDLDGIVYQEVPQPSSARSNSTNNAREYGYVNGDVVSGPGYVRVSVSPEQAQVDYVRTFLPNAAGSGETNGDIAFSYTLSADAK